MFKELLRPIESFSFKQEPSEILWKSQDNNFIFRCHHQMGDYKWAAFSTPKVVKPYASIYMKNPDKTEYFDELSANTLSECRQKIMSYFSSINITYDVAGLKFKRRSNAVFFLDNNAENGVIRGRSGYWHISFNVPHQASINSVSEHIAAEYAQYITKTHSTKKQVVEATHDFINAHLITLYKNKLEYSKHQFVWWENFLLPGVDLDEIFSSV